uniref:Uncharacterized protein n=1 Tax=Arundo donax TaxID=35708 RepID=A0A0A9H3Q4_ARUDO
MSERIRYDLPFRKFSASMLYFFKKTVLPCYC